MATNIRPSVPFRLVGTVLFSLIISVGCSDSNSPAKKSHEKASDGGNSAASGQDEQPRDPNFLAHDADGQPAGEVDLSEYPELQNLMQLSPRVFSGSEPHDEEAFISLARLGISTIVSVDGATPNVEAAKKFGLRYIHIPFGYDGVDEVAKLSLTQVVRESSGTIYIHCHHGKHRGPAAAAIACMAAGAINHEEAIQIMDRAGTSKEYAGLWRDVENFEVPAVDAVLPALVEINAVGSFVAAMAKLDRAYDNLKLCRDANWATPNNHPDLVPVQEALLLKEGLRESGRNFSDEYGDEVKNWLTQSESLAQSLEDALRQQDTANAFARFQKLEESCKHCHAKYRNH